MDLEPVIGLEIHAQVSTCSKMFCGCKNDSFGEQPNTNVCPICMGFPGMLPVLNGEVLKKGVSAALAFGCRIPPFSKFDRKNYFYPDLPKGFQISQYDEPIAVQGKVEIEAGAGGSKIIRVHRLHLEDDAGKLIHTPRGTLSDYNRSGSPLMEVVSEADMRSVEEASAYAQEVRRILRHCGASECDMEKGMMRFDLNISLRPKGEEKFGTKVEIKNLNSFRSLERAAAFEIERQKGILAKGEKVIQETRGWDDGEDATVSQRSKEEAHDYRYFPEPDLPPLVMDHDEVLMVKALIPELPLERKRRFMSEYDLSSEDALLLTEEKEMADFFEEAANTAKDPKKAFSFITTILLKHLNADKKSIRECAITGSALGGLIDAVNRGVISNNMAKTEVFEAMYATGKSSAAIIKEKNLAVVSDTGTIEAVCRKVVQENPGPVADFKGGKNNAFGFLVGKVMQEMKGKANPVLVNEILKKLL